MHQTGFEKENMLTYQHLHYLVFASLDKSWSFLVMCDLSLSSLAGRLNRKHALLLPALGVSSSCAQLCFALGFDAHLSRGFRLKPPKLRREIPESSFKLQWKV